MQMALLKSTLDLLLVHMHEIMKLNTPVQETFEQAIFQLLLVPCNCKAERLQFNHIVILFQRFVCWNTEQKQHNCPNPYILHCRHMSYECEDVELI